MQTSSTLHPKFSDCGDSTPVQKISQYSHQHGRSSFRGRETFRGGRPSHRDGLGGGHPERPDYTHSTENVCEYCGFWPQKSKEKCRALNQECCHCERLGYFTKMCRQNPDNHQSDKTEVKHIDMEEQSTEYVQSEYTTP